MSLAACVPTHYSSNLGTALVRKYFVQPWTEGDDKEDEADQVAHQWSSVVTAQEGEDGVLLWESGLTGDHRHGCGKAIRS